MSLKNITSGLSRLSGRLLTRILVDGGSRLLALAVGLCLVSFLLDFTLEPPLPVRAILLLLMLGLLGAVALRRLLRPLAKKPSLDELALLVEKADPGLKEQLISAIQLQRDLDEGRAVESPELIRAHVRQTTERLRDYSFRSAVPLGDSLRPLLLAALCVVLVGTLWASFPVEAGLWFERQVLLRKVSWPRETTLLINIPDIARFEPAYERDANGELTRVVLHVPERTPLQVQVTAHGVLPDEVVLVTAPLADPDLTQPISMGLTQGREYFQHIFPPLMRSLSIFARGGDDDDELPVYELRVAKAPRVTRFWCDYEYPSYTGMKKKSLSDSNISAPEGTSISMHFETNMPLSEFVLEFASGPRHALAADEAGLLNHTFLVDKNDFYTYRLKGENGVMGAEAPRYVITAEMDQAPRITVSLPESTDLSLTPKAVLPILGTVTDDYGITEIGYRWGSDPRTLEAGARPFAAEQLIPGIGERRVKFFHAVPVAELLISPPPAEGSDQPAGPAAAPKEGDRLYLGLLAVDNRKTANNPDPHRVFGDFEYRILILSDVDLERELTQRQVQIKGWVLRISDQVQTRLSELEGLQEALRASGDGTDVNEVRTRMQSLEREQGRITSDLVNTERVFRRVFDAYLWNRLDVDNNLAQKLMAIFIRQYGAAEVADRREIVKTAIEEVRPLLDDSSTTGVLTLILDLFQVTAYGRSPQVQKRLSRAVLLTDVTKQGELLESALQEQRLLKQDMLVLIDKLQAWEDFLGVLQGFQDALEMQEGIQKKIQKLTRKK